MLQTYTEEKRARVRPPTAEYLTVREILVKASTAADGVLWRERSDFSRCGFAILGFTCISQVGSGIQVTLIPQMPSVLFGTARLFHISFASSFS
jgi:hypothetical protein